MENTPKIGQRVRYKTSWGETVNAVIAEGTDQNWTMVRITQRGHRLFPNGTIVRCLAKWVMAR